MVHSSCGQWACPGSVLVQQQLLLLLLQVHIWWMMKLLQCPSCLSAHGLMRWRVFLPALRTVLRNPRRLAD